MYVKSWRRQEFQRGYAVKMNYKQLQAGSRSPSRRGDWELNSRLRQLRESGGMGPPKA